MSQIDQLQGEVSQWEAQIAELQKEKKSQAAEQLKRGEWPRVKDLTQGTQLIKLEAQVLDLTGSLAAKEKEFRKLTPLTWRSPGQR